MTDRISPTFRRIHLLQRVRGSESERSARILSLSEEGVYAETSEKFYLSSVLVTHLCL